MRDLREDMLRELRDERDEARAAAERLGAEAARLREVVLSMREHGVIVNDRAVEDALSPSASAEWLAAHDAKVRAAALEDFMRTARRASKFLGLDPLDFVDLERELDALATRHDMTDQQKAFEAGFAMAREMAAELTSRRMPGLFGLQLAAAIRDLPHRPPAPATASEAAHHVAEAVRLVKAIARPPAAPGECDFCGQIVCACANARSPKAGDGGRGRR